MELNGLGLRYCHQLNHGRRFSSTELITPVIRLLADQSSTKSGHLAPPRRQSASSARAVTSCPQHHLSTPLGPILGPTHPLQPCPPLPHRPSLRTRSTPSSAAQRPHLPSPLHPQPSAPRLRAEQVPTEISASPQIAAMPSCTTCLPTPMHCPVLPSGPNTSVSSGFWTIRP